ncbi:uncharacterized protein C8Q71DRAFT_282790 [Rhodofomes roseus]|uniref:Uncharacterized protein n=1 Tax=Rhodofomes roseus TaxID=34475 RepID=A0ABQ8K4C8_9APHY|nr:uncharacterized protein C8Q71DRAFT_282790 [Rhodofomes roseus]KAH9831743.1 hypothetical protein C8Q71DRAFT_282790 [Rhodofomes roseus]
MSPKCPHAIRECGPRNNSEKGPTTAHHAPLTVACWAAGCRPPRHLQVQGFPKPVPAACVRRAVLALAPRASKGGRFLVSEACEAYARHSRAHAHVGQDDVRLCEVAELGPRIAQSNEIATSREYVASIRASTLVAAAPSLFVRAEEEEEEVREGGVRVRGLWATRARLTYTHTARARVERTLDLRSMRTADELAIGRASRLP